MQERLPVLSEFLEESARGGSNVSIYASTFSHTEVAFGATEQQKQQLDTAIERKIDSLWADPGTVTSVEYHSDIAKVARGLIRDALTKGWSLKPADAIHLGTAQWLSSVGCEVDEFQTYDAALVKYESMVGFKILEPHTEQLRMI